MQLLEFAGNFYTPIATYEDEVLYEVGDATVSDDEETRDWSGNSFSFVSVIMVAMVDVHFHYSRTDFFLFDFFVGA
ncbi:unnamed protein product [Acanthoscelides obtectus]|uniref:Uncharacterized protein n=1 Tax=Acanthoscelides obtectus TaxID=200917 RepID=A0A9P0LXM2_ACAOB|nr:unnamed protein product [Acanthoscelides obtectus]CAK1646267.1 hypothetical protein AOBTE_LOCUS14542 [Acanthoscelides obtectus]